MSATTRYKPTLISVAIIIVMIMIYLGSLWNDLNNARRHIQLHWQKMHLLSYQQINLSKSLVNILQQFFSAHQQTTQLLQNGSSLENFMTKNTLLFSSHQTTEFFQLKNSLLNNIQETFILIDRDQEFSHQEFYLNLKNNFQLNNQKFSTIQNQLQQEITKYNQIFSTPLNQFIGKLYGYFSF
ncbi:MAG: hypothetical protein KIT27_11455 [Legionellales bacterium]|nr:hypothetical protein [Legionellales bacterium]